MDMHEALLVALCTPSNRLGNKVATYGRVAPRFPKHYERQLLRPVDGVLPEQKQRILELAQVLAKLDTTPNVLHLGQALAQVYGLEKATLLPWLKAARSLQLCLQKRGSQAFHGSINRLVDATHNDVPNRVANQLRRANTALTGLDLATALDADNKQVLMVLNMFEAMDRVVKFPSIYVADNKTPSSLWVQTGRQKKVTGLEPTRFGIYHGFLAIATQEPITVTRLRKLSLPVRGDVYVEKLLAAQLIERRPTQESNREPLQVLVLTTRGKKAYAEQQRLPYLNERLRLAYFGAKDVRTDQEREVDERLRQKGVEREHARVAEKRQKAIQKQHAKTDRDWQPQKERGIVAQILGLGGIPENRLAKGSTVVADFTELAKLYAKLSTNGCTKSETQARIKELEAQLCTDPTCQDFLGHKQFERLRTIFIQRM